MVDLFSYKPGPGLIHSVDARLKFFMEALFVTGAMSAEPYELLILTFFLFLGLRGARIDLVSLIRELRAFIPLFVIIFLGSSFGIIVRMFSTESGGFNANLKEFFLRGFFSVHTFVLIIGASRIFISSTRSSEIRSAVEFYLRPFPFIRGRHAAIMLDLMVGFFPLIFHAMEEIRDAGQSRCLSASRNPVRRIRFFILPLLETVFALADEVTQSLFSRCYAEDRNQENKPLKTTDLVFALTAIPLILIIIT